MLLERYTPGRMLLVKYTLWAYPWNTLAVLGVYAPMNGNGLLAQPCVCQAFSGSGAVDPAFHVWKLNG